MSYRPPATSPPRNAAGRTALIVLAVVAGVPVAWVLLCLAAVAAPIVAPAAAVWLLLSLVVRPRRPKRSRRRPRPPSAARTRRTR